MEINEVVYVLNSLEISGDNRMVRCNLKLSVSLERRLEAYQMKFKYYKLRKSRPKQIEIRDITRQQIQRLQRDRKSKDTIVEIRY